MDRGLFPSIFRSDGLVLLSVTLIVFGVRTQVQWRDASRTM
jgi:hypothetical protein